MKEDAPERDYPLRDLFNALRDIVSCGCQWRMLPNDLLPWQNVYQQGVALDAGMLLRSHGHDLCELSHLANVPMASPRHSSWTDAHRSPPLESGDRAGYDGYKRRKGSKVHIAVDTLGHLLAVKVNAANEQERAQVGELAEHIQQATGKNVHLAYVDLGYSGEEPARQEQRIRLEVVKLSEAQKGFVLQPKRWVVGTQFWLGGALQAPLQGLRASGLDSDRHVLAGFRPPYALFSIQQKN